MTDDYVRIQRNMSTGNLILAVAVFLLAVTNFIQDRELKEVKEKLNKIEQTPKIKCD